MSRTSEFTGHQQADGARGGIQPTPADAARSQQDVLRGLEGKQACPFCGAVSEKSHNPCARCGMDNTPESRKATKARIGPWYVLQARNPAAPGMRFDTLLTFVRKGRVRARSVVRGPTTHQLWRFAAHVKGLSREFGLCFSCGSSIETTANICPQCNRLQEPPINPDVLLDGVGVEDATPRASVAGPVFRELPGADAVVAPSAAPPAPRAAAAPAPAPRVPEPEDVDIVVPALGGFGLDDVEPKVADLAAPLTPSPAAPASRTATAQPGPAPRAGGDENPFSIPPVRKKLSGDPGFLSAKDLAAAFKLSFDPSADMDRIDVPERMPASALPEGMDPVTMPRNPLGPHPQPARSGGGAFRKVLVFLLVLALSGFAVLMWVDPLLRQKTIDWTKAAFARMRAGDATPAAGSRVEDDFDAPLPATTPAGETDIPAADQVGSDASDLGGIDPAPGPDASTYPEPAAAGEPVSDPAPDVAAESPARPPSNPAPAASGTRRPGSRVNGAAKPPVERSPAPEPGPEAAAGAPAADDPAPSMQRMRDLKQIGLDAEAAGDYEAAIRAFEAIKRMPPEFHPSDLKLLLRRVADAQLK